ncbi:nucleoside phosphorylase [Hyunsoonleella pacifica]|uniref:Uridine phosphorylase n=1 Tax=Hyunsoonleella pacifica TaxID=1080224 RepID=A0A4Q9FUG6_9FLAO|nr:nucleoside phosphorylase [Hyunsoonleella pacifica]TBN17739.1 phosphorylase [Hyunsoonleella pacifica]GGD09364.1 phosphorylase [Hyunsoonleella pacifica]
MQIKASELILNPDGSIYHLNLKPNAIADTIILVGDQDRVDLITKHFDSIEFETQKREFKTQTGTINNKRISVISTGIGTDNIDIVLNELDALVNINFETRTVNKQLNSLNIIRIGTSGALQPDIPIDSFLISRYAIDLNGMLHSYQTENISNADIEAAFVQHTQWSATKAKPIIIEGSKALLSKFESVATVKGVTATANGFYGPQGRVLRLPLQDSLLNKKIDSFRYKNTKITNLEMETSGIYGLSKLLGHNAISLNAIIANRANGTFSENPLKTIENLITYTLERI